MPDITEEEIKFYRSQVVSADSSNGGPIDQAAEAIDGASQNYWPTTFAADRAAGTVVWRKQFARIENADDYILANAFWFARKPTDSPDDRVVFIGAGNIATQGDIVGTEDHFGSGALNATVAPGATAVDVLVETGTPVLFRDGDPVVIADAVNIEARNISGAPSNVGDVWTITLDVALANGYSDTDSYVSSAISFGSLKGSFENPVVSSAAGLWDHTACTVHSIGAVEDVITFQFTSATAFDASGPFVGALGSGNVGTPFSPTNPSTGTPYFTIPVVAWGGTFAIADQATADMDPAIATIFARKTLNAGAAVYGGNDVTMALYGESVAP